MKKLKLIDDRRRFKYGVIGLENAKNDLENWDSFAFAGRMYKPVLTFIDDDSSLH